MTRKDFALLAEMLSKHDVSENLNKAFNVGASSVLASSDKAMSLLAIKDQAHRELVGLLADFCQTQNPRFDRERFISACEGK
jgi:hypothetical protein